jgi:hypothetical protein
MEPYFWWSRYCGPKTDEDIIVRAARVRLGFSTVRFMSKSPPQDLPGKRSNDCFPPGNVERIAVDISNLAIGLVELAEQADFSTGVKFPSDPHSPSNSVDSSSGIQDGGLLAANSWDNDEVTCSTYAIRGRDMDDMLSGEEDFDTTGGGGTIADFVEQQQRPGVAAAPEHSATNQAPPTAGLSQQAATGSRKNKKPSQRNRFFFAKQRFNATSDFYLEVDNLHPLPSHLPLLLGQIDKCPRKDNNHMFVVRWSHQQPSKAKIPMDLIPHLRTKYPKLQYQDAFVELIGEFEVNPNRATAVPTNTLLLPPAVVAAVVMAAASTPPVTPITAAETSAALAAIYTAGSTGWSQMSSLGCSQLFPQTPTNHGDDDDDNLMLDEDDEEEEVVVLGTDADNHGNGRAFAATTTAAGGTRSRTRLRAVDSDDDVTVGDDDYELDENDNFWKEREREYLEMVCQEDMYNSDSEDDDGSDESDFGDNVMDIAALLRGATDFDFDEISPEQVRDLPAPPKVFDGRSGLKEGVAESILTPFDAFRQSGFTDETIRRWTKNSNK